MKKLFLLGALCTFGFIFRSEAQTTQWSTQQDAYGNYIMYGYLTDYGNGSLMTTSMDDGSGVYETDLTVWATGDQGDWIDLIDNNQDHNQQLTASGSYDPTIMATLYPGENFVVHVNWEVLCNDGNWCYGLVN